MDVLVLDNLDQQKHLSRKTNEDADVIAIEENGKVRVLKDIFRKPDEYTYKEFFDRLNQYTNSETGFRSKEYFNG